MKYFTLIIMMVNTILFASENDSITLNISIDSSLVYTQITIQNSKFKTSKKINQSQIKIKSPTFEEPQSAFIILEGESYNFKSVVLNDFDIRLHVLKDTIWFEDEENQKLNNYLSIRDRIRAITPKNFLQAAEDSLAFSFIKSNPHSFSALEILEGLIIQNHYDINTYQTLFENFKNENLSAYSIYKRIQWKLDNFDKKLQEGSELIGKKIEIFNHKGIPYFMNSILAQDKPTLFVVCTKNCYPCNLDFKFIEENRAKIDSSYDIHYISIEEHHETALQHIELENRKNYHYVTDGFLSKFVFLMNITKTPTYIEVTPDAIISNLDFNIRYLEREIPDYPFTIERVEKLKVFNLYHQSDAVEVSNIESLEEIKKIWKENKLSRIEITSSADTIGNNNYNQRLSQQRANYVANQLKEAGIEADNIEIVGLGEIDENILDTARVSRVEIVERKTYVFKPGETIHFLKIFFLGTVSSIIPESRHYLDELLDIMKRNPSLKIKITGHICCNLGEGEGVDFNTNEKNLSWARARVIKDFLMENGIDETRLEIEGMAHKNPRYKGGPEVEKYNRRVEIVVLDY